MSAEGWAEVELSIRGKCRSALMKALLDDRAEMILERSNEKHAMRGVWAEFRRLRRLPIDILQDLAIAKVEENNLCANGGGEIYIDREGCHTVSLPDDYRTAEEIAADLETVEPAEETETEFRAAMAEYIRGWRSLAMWQRWREGKGPKPEPKRVWPKLAD